MDSSTFLGMVPATVKRKAADAVPCTGGREASITLFTYTSWLLQASVQTACKLQQQSPHQIDRAHAEY